MSKLLAYLVDNPVDGITKDVIVSKRLKDFKFKISPMSGTEFGEFQKLCTSIDRKGKQSFNAGRFNELVVINKVIEPSFRDAEAIKASGVMTPEQFLNKSLLGGEIQTLSEAVVELSGFGGGIDEEVDNAKN